MEISFDRGLSDSQGDCIEAKEIEMTEEIAVTVTCQDCGHKSTTYTRTNGDEPDSIATCSECGSEFGLVSDLKAAAFKYAESQAQAALKKIKFK